jgi:hypothetical protein
MSKTDVPKALREVWAWKKSLQRGLEGMRVEDALRAISQRSEAAATRLGFLGQESGKTTVLRLAEAKSIYRTTGKQKG